MPSSRLVFCRPSSNPPRGPSCAPLRPCLHRQNDELSTPPELHSTVREEVQYLVGEEPATTCELRKVKRSTGIDLDQFWPVGCDRDIHRLIPNGSEHLRTSAGNLEHILAFAPSRPILAGRIRFGFTREWFVQRRRRRSRVGCLHRAPPSGPDCGSFVGSTTSRMMRSATPTRVAVSARMAASTLRSRRKG